MRHLHLLEFHGTPDSPPAGPRDPNAHLRARISQMAAIGLPDYQIAFIVCIAVETLHDFFNEEIESSAAEANSEVLQTLFQLAKSGKHPSVTMFWAKSRCGFQPRPYTKKESPGDFYRPPPQLVLVNNDGEPVRLD